MARNSTDKLDLGLVLACTAILRRAELDSPVSCRAAEWKSKDKCIPFPQGALIFLLGLGALGNREKGPREAAACSGRSLRGWI